MNFEAAKSWFEQYKVGNESFEDTFNRLRGIPSSRTFHDSNNEAIDVIRRNRPETSVRMDPIAFIQQFASRPTIPLTGAPAPEESQRGMDRDRQQRHRENVEHVKGRDPRRSRSQDRSEAVSSQAAQQVETADERKKRLNRERQQRYRARKAEEASARGQRSVALDDQRQQQRENDAARKALRRAEETEEERERRRATVAASMSQHRAEETEEERERRRATVAASMSQHRAEETVEERERRRATVAASMSQHRAEETEEERDRRRELDAIAHSQHRAEETEEIANATQELFHRANFDENAVTPHYLGPMNVKCRFCGSYNFKDEEPADKQFVKCCQKGKLIIPKPVINGVEQNYPTFLQDLMSNPQNPLYRNFRDNIRSYNSSVSFASFGANLVNVPGRGPYVFKVQGQTYHLSSHTEPRNENERSFAQLYVIDSLTQAVQTRMQHPANAGCRPEILRQIHSFFLDNNSIARSYQLMHEVQTAQAIMAAAQNVSIPLVHMVMRTDRQSDERRFNLPTSNEVAMIFVNEDGEPPFNRDIRIYPRNPQQPDRALFRLNIRNSNLDPMVYSIMFPYGQPGWHPEYRCNNRHFSMLQHKSALMAIRDEFSPILSAGKLTQQWLVDSYLQVEAHNLEYVRFNQNKIRSELYQGLADYVNTRAAEAGVTAGRPVILPSSFQGSPRNMRERLQDAMAIFGKFGPPDLFVTFTANPNWREFRENSRPGETASDRSDLIGKIFRLKLRQLVRDITVNGIFGRNVAYVYTIEFQKRGLPHAHILIVLADGHKFLTSERIDDVVCAEIPDPVTNPILYDIVVAHMLHGPCGDVCRGDDGKCSKNFPKDWQQHTVVNKKGYPAYRRRSERFAVKNGHVFNNRYVVPYNKFLLLKYNAHINVEVCTSLNGVKYIYKYIYKGFDSANCKIGHVDGQQVFIHDEISNYISARYVSAPEAYWRLATFKMHDRSHAVISLPVHLPRQNLVYFEEGHEEEALAEARNGVTKLTQWFSLNQRDPSARNLLYTEIPYSFVYRRNEWQTRQRGGEKLIARMYGVSPRDEERFCLRLLLLNVPGATSYEYIRTVNGVEYQTFKEAATHRRLLSSDDEFDRFLHEAANSQMPYQLRHSFAYLCIFCLPQNARILWDKYTDDFILDLTRQNPRDAAINIALHELQIVFASHGTECAKFGLPTPTGTYIEAVNYDQTVERDKAARLIPTLNAQQRTAFDAIVQGIDNPSSQKLFYLNGPGGSGKTYLYKALISFVRGRGQIVKACASTGIAATLMDDGCTIHSGFGIPVKVKDSNVSWIKKDSATGKELRRASLLILDEITMLNKDCLRIIDKLLKEEIMKNDLPFGGKVLVISGDFRQTLPIVLHGTRASTIEATVINTTFWEKFQQISLITNMRSSGQALHNQWLLDIGSGTTERIAGLSENAVEIPSTMITHEDIVTATFGNDIRNLTVDQLSTRVILASRNEVTLRINNQIINQLDGELITYTSSDSIITDDENTEQLYPVEFLNAQTPSGMPPHKISLKLGAVVMLLRNLDRKKGLCNGTRLIVRGLHENFIVCEIISESHKGETVFISRLDMTPSETTMPFQMKRRQFPIIPAFAITINKSQGQSYEIVGILLDQPVFGHGQLYVALSRCRDAKNIRISIVEGPKQGRLLNNNRYFTENVVYKEVFGSLR